MEDKLREAFRDKFHHYEMDDPRDVIIDENTGTIEDFWLSKRREELEEIVKATEKKRDRYILEVMSGSAMAKPKYYDEGADEVISLIKERMR